MGSLKTHKAGRDKLAACVGKQPFETMNQAIMVAKRMGGNAKAFRCPHCHGYHVGHGQKR
jgi:hypothetical protein